MTGKIFDDENGISTPTQQELDPVATDVKSDPASSPDQPESPTIIITAAKIKEAVHEAIQEATAPLQDSLNEMAQQVQEVKDQLPTSEKDTTPTPETTAEDAAVAAVVETTQQAKDDITQTIEQAKDDITQAVEQAVIAINEAVQNQSPPIQMETTPQLTGTIITPLEEIADPKLTETIITPLGEIVNPTPIPIDTPPTPTIDVPNPNHPMNNLIEVISTQIKSFNKHALIIEMVLVLIIIGLGVYIAVDKFNGDKQIDQIMMNQSPPLDPPFPSVMDLLNLNKQEPSVDAVDANTYGQIIQKQTDVMEDKSISDRQIQEAILKEMEQNEKFSELFQVKLEALKKSGLPDHKAIPQAFLDESLIPPIIEALPENIKAFPIAEEFIKKELKQISKVAEQQLLWEENQKRSKR